ncbi:hypothetical protein B0H13DRAFT_2467320, partial [Mycena leptocephala]
IKYLDTIVSDFAKDAKPSFVDTHKECFPAIDPEDHYTSPDITATRPNQAIPEQGQWQWTDAGIVLELKLKTDIFKEGKINASQDSQDVLVQIAKSPRSLLASDRYVAFVVAIVKKKARILRFDRAGYRTSEAFDWSKKNNVLPRFFWRLYNPEKNDSDDRQARMYGEDDTVSIPTLKEKRQMYKLWQKTSSYKITPSNLQPFEVATQHSRWVKAARNNESVFCFTMGPPLYQSDALFSRATRVDRVVIKDDSNPTVYALKDAWRLVYRRPETDFYDVIAKYCKEKIYPTEGMAQCLGSVALSEHTTNSAAHEEQERYHTRSLLTPVGIPLKHFPSSKELILALWAAVVHHKIAYEAGVLHRDISDGNVMFDEETMKGFLIDWDYAEFTSNGLKNFQSWFEDRAKDVNYLDSLKELTGTYPFMAIELLDKANTRHEVHHDLESFYWLLTWITLRYTAHN